MKAEKLSKLYPDCDREVLDWSEYPTRTGKDTVGGLYDKCRKSGSGDRFAAMAALQKAPKAMTDREFFEGRGTLLDQFGGNEKHLDSLVKVAKKNGYTPGIHDVYDMQLAQYAGDPKGFIPATGGRGHIRAVCEERGLSCEGAVNVQGRESDPEPSVRLAEDLVQEEIKSRIEADPALQYKDRNELREEVISKHGSKGT